MLATKQFKSPLVLRLPVLLPYPLGFRSLIGNASSVWVPIAFGLAVGPLGVAPLLWAGAGLISSALPAAQRGVRHHLR